VVEARPSAPVVLVAGATDPPPDATDQLTEAPARAAPSRATRTTMGLARAWLDCADWASPLEAAIDV